MGVVKKSRKRGLTPSHPNTDSDYSWEGYPVCEYAKYTVEITSPDEGDVFKKDSGTTGSATAQRVAESGTTDEPNNTITWSDGNSGGTSKDFTTIVGSKTLTASANGASHSVTVTIVEITIKPPADTQDGSASGQFKIEVNPSTTTIDSYEWSYSTPAGAARVPNADIFDSKTSSTPKVTKAQWFSTTGSKWQEESGPAGDAGAPMRSPYTISCEVQIDGNSLDAPPVNWNVYIPEPGVLPPSVSGTEPQYTSKDVANDQTEVTVTGSGQLSRSAPQMVPNGILRTNTFFDKIIEAHENEHMDQWDNQAPWKNINSVSYFMSVILNKKYTGGYVEAVSAPRLAWTNYKEISEDAANRDLDDGSGGNSSGKDLWYVRERLAHTKSNAVSPDFLEVHINTRYPSPGTVSFSWSLPTGWK